MALFTSMRDRQHQHQQHGGGFKGFKKVGRFTKALPNLTKRVFPKSAARAARGFTNLNISAKNALMSKGSRAMGLIGSRAGVVSGARRAMGSIAGRMPNLKGRVGKAADYFHRHKGQRKLAGLLGTSMLEGALAARHFTPAKIGKKIAYGALGLGAEMAAEAALARALGGNANAEQALAQAHGRQPAAAQRAAPAVQHQTTTASSRKRKATTAPRGPPPRKRPAGHMTVAERNEFMRQYMNQMHDQRQNQLYGSKRSRAYYNTGTRAWGTGKAKKAKKAAKKGKKKTKKVAKKKKTKKSKTKRGPNGQFLPPAIAAAAASATRPMNVAAARARYAKLRDVFDVK